MFKYQKIGIEIAKSGIPYKSDKYDYIIAAKPNSLETYNLLKAYYSAAKTSGCDTWYINSPNIMGEYEGEDWYFLEGHDADRDSPCTYRLESLTYKKNKFADFCAQFE